MPCEDIYPRLDEEAYKSWRKGEGDTLADHLWDVKGGVTRTVGQLRSLEGNILGKGPAGVGGKLGWLCERSNNDTIKVDRILTRYFIPTEEYMAAVLKHPNMTPKTTRRGKKLPLYMITGLMIAVGFSMSKAKGVGKRFGGEGGATDPSSGAGAKAGAEYRSQDTANTDIERSSDIVLGFRVRKIYWEGEAARTTDEVAGRTLGEGGSDDEVPNNTESLKVVDDFGAEDGSTQDVFVVKEGLDG